MRLVFLGGASEIGASSLFAEVGGVRFLVDAGIRLGADDSLPDLGRLRELGGVDVIVVTHAHLDHIGSLPLVSQAYPAAPVYCTPATSGIIRVMLGDALRVMESRLEAEGEVPLYSASAVETLIERLHPVPYGIRWTGPGYSLQLAPAGHVLGAAMAILDASGERLVVSGDVSGDEQRTVDGCQVPRLDARPDALVLEATYGALLHPNRRAEEERLAKRVAEVVLGGGKALIPAFALGRGQEIIFALRAAQEAKIVPRFPIYVDGLVGAICSLYAGYAESGSRELRRRARLGDPFFDRTGWVTMVKRGQREKLLTAAPAAIVASSGMLTGGPSAFYASRLAGDARNAILITGYQDEEAPGRRLLELASGERKSIMLGGQEIAVAAKVERYGLSAHADGARLAALAQALNPRRVVLCHGETDSREALARLIEQQPDREVFTPINGEMLDFVTVSTRRALSNTSAGGTPVGESPPAERSGTTDVLDSSAGATIRTESSAPAAAISPSDVDAPALHARLVAQGAVRHYAVRELAALAFGRTSAAHEAALAEALEASPLFRGDSVRKYLFRPVVESGMLTADSDQAPVSGRLEQNVALAKVESELPPATGLYRKGAHLADGRLLLFFHFPDVARECHAAAIARLAEETGWQVEIHPSVHQGELVSAARRTIGAAVVLAREPAVHLTEKAVRLKLAPGSPDPASASLTAFRDLTGFSLEVEASADGRPVTGRPVDGPLPGAWEQNYLLARVDERFARKPHRPYRKGLKSDHLGRYLELSFTTPAVGARYAELLADLAKASGWRVLVGDQVNQQALIAAVENVLPAGWWLAKTPSVHHERHAVTIALAESPAGLVDEGELVAAAARFADLTGYRLERG